ncbi:hypothetical protein [Sphaerisporangium fuscum]|uniref:hypothetical protein n=1 Tax=Sphaerisporangium fuscum TaxID=2835868 RepID=UPI001BDC0955|nr:hypothetical protein [Sphaerisporangium fuscum]
MTLDNPQIRTAAYDIALRITPRAWDVTEVKQRAERIVRFLAEARTDEDFQLRYTALDLQTTAMGCHPRTLTGTERTPARPTRRDVADIGDADTLIDAARKILTWLTR